jgi:hypothetical protein
MCDQYPFAKAVGYLTAPSTQQPTSMQAYLESAMAEHLRVHANDGLSLFVLATTCATDSKLYLYPISAQDFDLALQIAMTLHASRGLAPADGWTPLLKYPDPSSRHFVA